MALLVASATGCAPPAAITEDFETNQQRCLDPATDLDQRISTCTSVRQSKQLAEESVPVSPNSRGIAWWRKGEYDRAIEDYGRAIEIDPKDAVACLNRGLAYWGKGEHDRVEDDLRSS